MIKVKIKDLRTKPKVKVGDRVEFQIGEETLTDTVNYVMDHVVEGEKYDLTYVNFTIKK
jgi:ribosomal 50S subunit-recycling heat shock protein